MNNAPVELKIGKSSPALIVAMDHARSDGVVSGLQDPLSVARAAIDGGADGIMSTYGTLRLLRAAGIEGVPTVMRLDGGPTRFSRDWLDYDQWRLLYSLEDALRVNASAVIVMLLVGSPAELQTIEIVCKVVSEFHENTSLPVFVEALPCASSRIPDACACNAVAHAVRIAFEHGADGIKTSFCGNEFSSVVSTCPVPILIAGGPHLDSPSEIFSQMADARDAGACGAFIGRNVWQSSDPVGRIRALKGILNKELSVEEATLSLNLTSSRRH